MSSIAETLFVDILKDGVNRTSNYMASLTDFHGGPITTEYILTSDIARAFLDKGKDVDVEYQNRRLVNNMTVRKGDSSRKEIWGMRTDVVVTEGKLIPVVMIEVKIRIKRTLGPIKDDLAKMAKTLQCMKARYAENVRAASVFQISVSGKAKGTEINRLKKKLKIIEQKLADELCLFAKNWPDFQLKLVSLQEENAGFVPTEILQSIDSFHELGENGHATRYYAILIQSIRNPTVGTALEQMKRGD